MAKIAVIMTTYAPEGEVGDARKEYAWQAVTSLCAHLEGADFRLHFADDGSADTSYLYELMALAGRYWNAKHSFTSIAHQGIGASLNNAIRQTQEQLWMYTTDDWLLTGPLDASPAVDLIEKYSYDYVRLGPIHPHLMCSTEFNQDAGWWLRIHQKWGGFAFATRPFITTRNFWNRIGLFKEQVDSYECERDYAVRVGEHQELKLASINIHGPWKHIGVEDIGIKDDWVGIRA